MTDTVNAPRELLTHFILEDQAWPELDNHDVLTLTTPEGEASPFSITMGTIRAISALAAAPKAVPVEADDFGDALLAFLFRHGLKVALDVSEIEALRQSAIRAQPEAPKVDQEPVAYVSRKGFTTGGLVWTKEGMVANLPDETKLYTHPAPSSDELLEALEPLVVAEKMISRGHHGFSHDRMIDVRMSYNDLTSIVAIAKHKGPQ